MVVLDYIWLKRRCYRVTLVYSRSPLLPPEIRMGPHTAISIGLELSEYAVEKAIRPEQQFAFAVVIIAPPENAVIGTFINELFTIPTLLTV